jgi:ribosomal protein S11
MEQKVKDGATKALQDTGVTDVVNASGRGASSAAAIQALTASTLALTKIMDKMEMSQ